MLCCVVLCCVMLCCEVLVLVLGFFWGGVDFGGGEREWGGVGLVGWLVGWLVGCCCCSSSSSSSSSSTTRTCRSDVEIRIHLLLAILVLPIRI